MSGTNYVWPSIVNCTMNHEGSSIEETSLAPSATFKHVAFAIYQDQIASVDESEAMYCQWQSNLTYRYAYGTPNGLTQKQS